MSQPQFISCRSIRAAVWISSLNPLFRLIRCEIWSLMEHGKIKIIATKSDINHSVWLIGFRSAFYFCSLATEGNLFFGLLFISGVWEGARWEIKIRHEEYYSCSTRHKLPFMCIRVISGLTPARVHVASPSCACQCKKRRRRRAV